MLKSRKLIKTAFVCLTAVIIFVITVLPSYAASAGTDRISYPTIPMELELRYPDKAVSLSITDNIYQNNSVNHDEIIVSGRHLFTSVITKSTQSYGYLTRKNITSDYSLAPIGIDISCPTFYLVKDTNGTSFTITVPYFKIPSTIYCEGFITYDVSFGEFTHSVYREINSPIGSSNNFVLYTFAEIQEGASLYNINWTSCCISNWRFTSTSFTYGDQSTIDESILNGTWVIDTDFEWIGSPPNGESYNTYYIPFRSNGRNFVGIVFGDTVKLFYRDTVGQVQNIEVWNVSLGWLNEEYRTIYFTDQYTWNDVVGTDGFQDWDGSSYFMQWLQTNATKRGTEDGYDGGSIVEWRYQTMFTNYSIDSFDYYTAEYSDLYNFQLGYDIGKEEGREEGERIGYDKAMSERSPNVTTWLATAASGFLAFELIPGISILGIISIMISLSLAIVLLKFFAGG